MQSKDNTPPIVAGTIGASVPPLPPEFGPPAASIATPPALPSSPARSALSQSVIAQFLSLCLALFSVSAALALLDDSLVLFFKQHWLTNARMNLLMLGLLMSVALYAVMGLTPMISKRRFLPMATFIPLAMLGIIPFMIYGHDRIGLISWAISVCQVVVALMTVFWLRRGLKLGWPLVPLEAVRARLFSCRNTFGFAVINLFLLLPLAVGYLAACASMAVHHFSDGFIALRPEGVVVEERTFVRADSKTVQLVPMSHIGNASFYRTLSASFPPGATILMEGVTDQHSLLTNRITYQRVAKSLGVVEQQQNFKPRGKIVHADIDVDQFRTNTIDFVNMAMLFHSKGLNRETVGKLLTYSEPAGLEEELIYDMLTLRNWHLMKQIRNELANTSHIIVPWGAAHMPEVARELMKLGFRVSETKKHVVIQFKRN